MPVVRRCALPPGSALGRYDLAETPEQRQNYTDCYSIAVHGQVSLKEYATAFYTTWLFRVERMILARLAGKPSSDADAAALANGAVEEFAAWYVEWRSSDELLMCDFREQTRSWFKVMPLPESEGGVRTRLWFGSAVVFNQGPGATSRPPGLVFRLLLGFHKLYSRALLGSAARRLRLQFGAHGKNEGR